MSGAVTDLQRLAAQREILLPALDRTRRALAANDPAEVDTWARASLALHHVNAGAACQLAFWRVSEDHAARLWMLSISGFAGAEVCKRAGAGATLACLQSLREVLDIVRDRIALTRWWQALERLAREAPDCVKLVAARAASMLADPTCESFTDFVAFGLKAYAPDPSGRRAHFSLADDRARAVLRRRAGIPDAKALLRMLAGFSTALWGREARLTASPSADTLHPRVRIAGAIVLLPASVDVDHPERAHALYLAAVAHADAHLALPPVRHAVGTLKPLQIVLATLVEDARVEALAMRRFPGLRHVWQPFHTPEPAAPRTAVSLMTRLACGLFDLSATGPDGFVRKAQTMFADETRRCLDDPALSLRIGRVLGHDFGQMRLGFDWRGYLVEPAYRDDGSHLWDHAEQADTPSETLVQAGQTSADPSGGSDGRRRPLGRSLGRSPGSDTDERSPPIATYPEWDRSAGIERPDWTTLRDAPVPAKDPGALLGAIAAEARLRRRIDRLVRATAIGRPKRQRRQSEGEELDIDAAHDALLALRGGLTPDMRVFRTTHRRARDLATLVVLDVSASTGAALPDGRSILDVQRLAVGLLANALDARGDPIALSAFASDGRDDVRLYRIKMFDEPVAGDVMSRLAGLGSALSTRLGTALRHAGAQFDGVRAWRRLLLVLTDAEPADIDVPDNGDLVVDAGRAVLALRQAGIDVFGLVLDPTGAGSADAIFGRKNTLQVRDLADLPNRLAGLYFRLANR